MERMIQSLNGIWDYRIGKGPWESKTVPFSALCVGESECRVTFSADGLGKRAVLNFEGITYEAEVVLNGIALGEMLPYCHYDFDISDLLKPEGNLLSIRLRDIGAAFGPSEGWENYGGIIRGVYIEYLPSVYIKDFIFKTRLSRDYTHAICEQEVRLGGDALNDYIIEAALLRNGREVCSASKTSSGSACSISLELSRPELWSPEAPNLYELELSLIVDGAVADRTRSSVGIKDFQISGNRFILNGEPIFLQGVCRHDTWGHAGGHTLTEEQMLRDMLMIKSTGANYVRLVHYPHSKRIVELADKTGLLISEEPGLWWADLSDTKVTSRALEVLRRTIIRDRNNVSIAFWLAFNECSLKSTFVADAARVARETDDTRPISGANCMNPQDTKAVFSQQGFDFYTYHPYGSSPLHVSKGIGGKERSIQLSDVIETLSDKPLVFTEWGGWHVAGNPALFSSFMDAMSAAYDAEKLAGAAYWSWADIYETNRGQPACERGILTEGLTDVDRNPRPNLDVFARKLAERKYKPHHIPETEMEIYGVEAQDANYTAIDIWAGQDQSILENAAPKALELAVPVKGFTNKPRRKLTSGPLLPESIRHIGQLPVDIKKGMPIIITEELGPVVIPVHAAASGLYLIGQVSIGAGFPVSGSLGEGAGVCVISFADGTTLEKPLRNGIEIASVFGLHGPSRIDPRAAAARRVMKISYSFDWEVYYINALRIQWPQEKAVSSISIRAFGDYALVLCGVTMESLHNQPIKHEEN